MFLNHSTHCHSNQSNHSSCSGQLKHLKQLNIHVVHVVHVQSYLSSRNLGASMAEPMQVALQAPSRALPSHSIGGHLVDSGSHQAAQAATAG